MKHSLKTLKTGYSYNIRGLDPRIWILSATRFIRAFGRGSTFIFLPLVFIISYGISFLETGLFLGIATLLMALVQYYSGILTDRIGRRTILVYSQIPAVAFYLVIFYTVAFPSYLLFLLLSWYGTIVINAIQYPAVQAAVADVTSVKDRLSGYTVMRIMANMGIALGPLVGAYLASIGLQYIFLISAIATVAEIVLLYFLMNETYDPKEHPREGKHSLRNTYRKDRLFMVFTAIGVVLGFFMRQRGSSFTVYTVVLEHLPFIYLGYIWALNGFLVVLLQFPFLRMMTRFGSPMFWRGIGSGFYALSFILLVNVPSLSLLLAFMAVSTVGEDMVSPTTQSIITTIAPASMKGSYIGVYNMYTSIGGFTGAVIGLYLLYVFSSVPYVYWVYVAVGSIIVGVMYLTLGSPFNRRFSRSSSGSSTEIL